MPSNCWQLNMENNLVLSPGNNNNMTNTITLYTASLILRGCFVLVFEQHRCIGSAVATAIPMDTKHKTGRKRWMMKRSKNRTDIEHPKAKDNSVDSDKISKLHIPKTFVTWIKNGGKFTPERTVGMEAMIWINDNNIFPWPNILLTRLTLRLVWWSLVLDRDALRTRYTTTNTYKSPQQTMTGPNALINKAPPGHSVHSFPCLT